MTRARLELTWTNKDMALIPSEKGKYGYSWVDVRDPRYCEVRPLVAQETILGEQTPKDDSETYSERADLKTQTDNLLIAGESGDVLEALTKVPELAEKYVGQVKCVYIDPPFNTAQTFVNYEDNLEHSIWLTMMRDRLLHLRNLLRPDGTIWVHLDEVEVHRMRLLLDEVFGAGNFVSTVAWQKSDTLRNDSNGFSADFDYIIVYQRSADWAPNKLPRPAEMNAIYKSPDGDPKRWFNGGPTAPGARTHQGMVYAIQNPFTGALHYPLRNRCWALGQKDILTAVSEYADYELRTINDAKSRAEVCGVKPDDVREGVPALMLSVPLERAAHTAKQRHDAGDWPLFYFTGSGGAGAPGKKTYIPAGGVPPRTWWPNSEVGSNRTAKAEVKALIASESPFATPKPEKLLERVLSIATDPGDIVLDIFAGSGTTAAVAQKMGRRWVTCELLTETMERYTRPRMEKVIYDKDPGGITTASGERQPADGVELPEGITAEGAQAFTSLLNKVIAADPDYLKESSVVRQLKALTKTAKKNGAVQWRGGGGFVMATLAPQVFDYKPELGLVTLTEAATGEVLIRSVAANLGFFLTPEHAIFHGQKNSMRLYVLEGTLTVDRALDLASHLEPDEGLTIAATGRELDIRAKLRRLTRAVRVLHIPDDLFGNIGAEDLHEVVPLDAVRTDEEEQP